METSLVKREGVTTIQIKIETRARLDRLGDRHVSYDEIINRVLDSYEKTEGRKKK